MRNICMYIYILHILGGLNSTTTGTDYVYQNYTFLFNDGDKTKSLMLHPVDDNIVEPDEIYNLTIRIVSPPHIYVIVGENGTTTVNISDDDGK